MHETDEKTKKSEFFSFDVLSAQSCLADRVFQRGIVFGESPLATPKKRPAAPSSK